MGWVLLASGVGLALAIGGIVAAVKHRDRDWLGTGVGYIVAVLALAALFASVALGSLDGLLARMHEVGVADRGLEAFTGPGSGVGASFLVDTVQRWANWFLSAAATPRTAGDQGVASPTVVLGVYLVIDSLVFVPAYVTVLAMIRLRSSTLEPRWTGESSTESTKEPAWKDLGQFVRRIGFVAALAVADISENLLTEFLVRQPLRRAIVNQATVVVSDRGAFALQVATTAKWVFLALVIITTIPALMTGVQAARKQLKVARLMRGIVRLRAMIVLALLFGLVATMRIQVPDVLRRWDWRTGTFAAVGAITFGVVLWLWSRRILAATRDKTRQPTRRGLLFAAILVALVAITGLWWGPRGLAIPALALFLLWWLDSLGPEDLPTVDVPFKSGSHELPKVGASVLPKLLAVSPVVFLAVGALRARLPEAIFKHPSQKWPLLLSLVWFGIVPIGATIAMLWILGRDNVVNLADGSMEAMSERTSRIHGKLALGIRITAIALSAYIYWRVVGAVWSFSQAAGVIALAAVLFAMIAAAFGAISLWIERVPPPRALAGIGFKRTPIFAFVLVWLLLISVVERQPYHDVRVDLAIDQAVPAVTLDDALSLWQARNAWAAAGDDTTQVPMIFVAANGGGIKAAAWTALGLDCVLTGGDAIEDSNARGQCAEVSPGDTSRFASVFAMSGVSGGSVGLVEYLAHELQTRLAPDPGIPDLAYGSWIRHVLGDDLVSPSLAWQLFVDVPHAWLQFGADMDRAEVLERSWERGWLPTADKGGLAKALTGLDEEVASPLQRGFMTAWNERPQDLPLLLLNGATVEDGCRVIVSPLATDGIYNPDDSSDDKLALDGRNCSSIHKIQGDLPSGQLLAASRDARHMLCSDDASRTPQDVRLSTAALMSARFPWASPSGRLRFCVGDASTVHVVDGGYLDNSGGATLAELWEGVDEWVADQNAMSNTSCIVPYLILIDSGYGPTPDPKGDDISELTVPVTGTFSARSSRTIEGRNDAALAFRRGVSGVAITDRVATLYLRSQAGDEAPLGWTLDDTSLVALEAQLFSNQDQLDEIANWFLNPAPCLA